LALLAGTAAGLGAAMFVAGTVTPSANILATPALAKSLEETKNATRGWLGVRIQSMTAEIAESMGLKSAEGALIAEPQPNSPASKAGLKAGDVIASIDGARVKDAAEVTSKIAAAQPGATVELGIFRDSAEQTITVMLAERQQGAARKERASRANDEPRLGLVVAAAEFAGAEEGVLVTAIDPTGMAAGAGFRTGDIILDVAGRGVKTPEDVRKALADARSGERKHVLMRVKSSDGIKFVAVPLAPRA
jgi:serine protease Do